jgi:hypothetical protein
MPEIPLTVPNFAPAAFNIRGDHPRPLSKGLMTANFASHAIESVGNLQFQLARDRQRRDFNEAIFSAEKSLNDLTEEALLSNDPRTMLDKFNENQAKAFSLIREKIPNPRDQREFDFRNEQGVANARMRILGAQLEYERAETEAQGVQLTQQLFRRALLNPTPENLMSVRDTLDDYATERVETGDQTPTQAQNWMHAQIATMENKVLESLAVSDPDQAEARLLEGEFASITPEDSKAHLAKIKAERQNQNYNRLFQQIRLSEDLDPSMAQILTDLRNEEKLTQPDYEKLLNLFEARYGKNQVDKIRMERMEMIYSGQAPNFLDAKNPDDVRDYTEWAARELDPVHMRVASSLPEMMEMRMAELGKMGIGSDNWKADAYRIVANMDEDPDATIAAVRYLFEHEAIKRGILDEDQQMGDRARSIKRLADLNVPPKEIMKLVAGYEQAVERTDIETVKDRWASAVKSQPQAFQQGVFSFIDGDLRQYPHLEGKSRRDWISAFGERNDEGERRAARTASDHFIGFLRGELDISDLVPDFVPLLGPESGTEGRLDIGDLDPRNLPWMPDFIRPDAPSAPQQIPGIMEGQEGTRLAVDDKGIWASLVHIMEPGTASVAVPDAMLKDIEHLANLKFAMNGGDFQDALYYGVSKVFSGAWDLTRFHGPPRFDRHTVETSEPAINGSRDWTRDYLEDQLNKKLGEMVLPLEGIMGLAPRWEGIDNLPSYVGDLLKLFAFQATDDPNHPWRDKGFSEKAWEVSRRIVNSIMSLGDARAFPFNVYRGLAGPDSDREIVSMTTNERVTKRVQLADGTWEEKQIYHLGIRGEFGEIKPLWEIIPGLTPDDSEFFYDHTDTVAWQKQRNDIRAEKADLIVRRLAREAMKAGVPFDIEKARAQLGAGELPEASVELGYGVHSAAEAFDLLSGAARPSMPTRNGVPLGLATGGRGAFGSQPPVFQIPPPLAHGKVPPYDHEARMEEVRREPRPPLGGDDALRNALGSIRSDLAAEEAEANRPRDENIAPLIALREQAVREGDHARVQMLDRAIKVRQ